MKRWFAMLAVVGGLVMFGQRADAQSVINEHNEHNHLEIEVHGGVPYLDFLSFGYGAGYGASGFGFGGGAQVNIPIVPGGFGNFNNSLNIYAGGDFVWWAPPCYVGYYCNWAPGFDLRVGALWNVYLTPRISVFANLGFVANFIFYEGCGGCFFYPGFEFAVGARLHLGANNGFPALIVRFSTSGLMVGISF